MVHFFSSDPFYPKYVCMPGASSLVPPKIRYNPKFWPFFKDALGAIDGSHFASAPPQEEQPFCRNRKVSSHRTAFLHVHLTSYLFMH